MVRRWVVKKDNATTDAAVTSTNAEAENVEDEEPSFADSRRRVGEMQRQIRREARQAREGAVAQNIGNGGWRALLRIGAEQGNNATTPQETPLAPAVGQLMRLARHAEEQPRVSKNAEHAEYVDEEQEWSWDDYIVVQDAAVKVELIGAEIRDVDLESLVQHLEQVLQQNAERNNGECVWNMDLSCNLNITDHGVIAYIAPLLGKWPFCRRLKLYKTSIGDVALKALGSWISSGHARELHFSDLAGEVTKYGVLDVLRQVHTSGKYPYRNNDGSLCALWLRLEHNGIPSTEKIVAQCEAEGMSICVLGRTDLGRVRPGVQRTKRERADIPSVHLVLFHTQALRINRDAVPPQATELSQVTEASAPVQTATEPIIVTPQTEQDVPSPPVADLPHTPETPAPVLAAHAPTVAVPTTAATPVANAGDDDDKNVDGVVKPKGGNNNKDMNICLDDRLDRACRLVAGCLPVGGNKADNNAILTRWHRHLKDASRPEEEAHRIVRMMRKLYAQGFPGPDVGPATPSMPLIGAGTKTGTAATARNSDLSAVELPPEQTPEPLAEPALRRSTGRWAFVAALGPPAAPVASAQAAPAATSAFCQQVPDKSRVVAPAAAPTPVAGNARIAGSGGSTGGVVVEESQKRNKMGANKMGKNKISM